MNGLLAASTDDKAGITPTQLEAELRAEFRSLEFLRREFPMLSAWGVPDVGLAIHSLGLNYLAALGRELGCSAVTEYPLAHIDARGDAPPPDIGALEVRPDVVWFDPKSRRPILLAEFERFEEVAARHRTLLEKAENLVLAHHLAGSPAGILLLALWTLTGVRVAGLNEINTRIRSGFRNSRGTAVGGLSGDTRFLIATFIFSPAGGGLVLKEVLT